MSRRIFDIMKSVFRYLIVTLCFVGCYKVAGTFPYESHGDWLKYFTKTRVTVEMIDAVTEPLYNVLPYERIQYSSANVSSSFKSVTTFRTTGMVHLYTLTEKFIGVLQKDHPVPAGFIDILENGDGIHVADVGKEWPSLLWHYISVLAVTFVLLLYVFAMPAIGIAFCCCYYVKYRGKQAEPFDKRYDPCRRYYYGSLLCIVTILISFGVICSFTTNEYLEEGITTLPQHMNNAITDVELYMNNTKLEAENLFVRNYGELEQTLTNILEASGKIVINELSRVSKASALFDLNVIVDGLSVIKTDLKKIENLTKSIQSNALQLAQGLKESRETLLKKFNQCLSQTPCQEFLKTYSIRNLTVETDFSQLPNVTSTLHNISDLMTANIQREVMLGKEQFEAIQNGIQGSISEHLPPVKGQIKKMGATFNAIYQNIANILDGIREYMHSRTEETLVIGENFIDEYSSHRYYICLGISVVLLVILSCLCFGLLCGFLGSRPNGGYHEECCNKGTGSYYLMSAVWLMFISSSILMCFVAVFFVVGITIDSVYCQSLRATDNSFLITVLDRLVDVNKYYNTYNSDADDTTTFASVRKYDRVSVNNIIRDCHQNHSLYEVLQLERRLDIDQVLGYTRQLNFPQYINSLTSDIHLNQEISILTPNARRLLRELSDSPLNQIDFPAYTRIFSDHITSIDLMQLAGAINETAHSLPSDMYEVKHSLLNHALYLKTHQEYLVVSMVDMCKQIELTAHLLQEHMRFNHTSLKKAVDHLLSDVEEAQVFLKQEGYAVVSKLALEFGDEFISHIDEYLTNVVTNTRSNVGRCWPVSHAYNATVVATCKRILYPFNGFWMSVGCVLFLYIPAIMLCLTLATLYKKTDPYPGHMVDREYLYDVCSADQVPLNSAAPPVPGSRKTKNKGVQNSACNVTPPTGGRHSAATSTCAGIPVMAVQDSSTNTGPAAATAFHIPSPSNSGARPCLDIAQVQGWNAEMIEVTSDEDVSYERPPPYSYPRPLPAVPSSSA